MQESDIPRRSTVRRLIASVYREHFSTLIVEMRASTILLHVPSTLTLQFKASEGQLSLTVDGWDNKSMRAFLGVTVHFLRRVYSPNSRHARGMLKLESGLIAFLPMPGRHTGQELAKALLRVTDRAEITGRVCSLFLLN